MRLPATPGWVSLPVVVGAPRHSWLTDPGAVPRYSWLGSAGVWSLATPGCGSWLRFPATPGLGVRWWWGCLGPRHSWLRVLVGCSFTASGRGSRVRFSATPGWGPAAAAVGVSVGGGLPVLCVLVARRVCVVSVLVCVVCVRGVCVGGGAGVGVLSACVCVCVCVCVCGVLVCWWRVVAGPCFYRLLLVLVGVWLVCAVAGPLPLLAEVPVCDSPPLLARLRCRWWLVFRDTPG